jgi:hypothetical protein
VATLPENGAVDVGGVVTIIVTVKDANATPPINLPAVDGLTLNGSGTVPGDHQMQYTFFVTPAHAGDFVIPAFDIGTTDGQTLHVSPIKLHAQ